MTAAQVTKLETEVGLLKIDVKETKKLLKWFMALAVVILGIVAQIAISNAGFKRVMIEKDTNMRLLIDQNSLIISDIAVQGIAKGWYKPKYIFREYIPNR